MAVEKFIHGKVDDCRHEGKRAEVRRIADAEQQMKDYYNGEAVISQPVFMEMKQEYFIRHQTKINTIAK